MKQKKWKDLPIFTVFGWQEEKARGRTTLLLSTIFTNLCSYLAAGTLYTAFLTVNDFSLVDVSILGFLPAIATFVGSFLAPVLWERVEHRKGLLAVFKMAYYAINVLGITILPYICTTQSSRIASFSIVILLSNTCNAIAASGYSAWHINFLPEHIRAQYFSYAQTVTVIFGGVVLIVSGIIADALKGTPQEANALIVLRLIGFICGILDTAVLCINKESPYEHGAEKMKLLNVFILPFKARRFIYTMGFLSLWSFSNALTSACMSYFLLNTAHIPITLINSMTFINGLVWIVLMTPWQRILRRLSWFRTFSLGVVFRSLSLLLCAFILPRNGLWLYPLAMITQYVGDVPINFCANNLTYINMPKEDRTYYFSFSNMRMNLFGFLGQWVSSLLIQRFPEGCVLFGRAFDIVPTLALANFALDALVAILLYRCSDILTPPEEEAG